MLTPMDKGRHARLQRKHALLLRLAHDLLAENTQLRRKEKVMISLLAEQVDYLHNLGTITLLSACDGSSEATDKQTAAVVAALAADVEAYHLLQQLQQVQPPSHASSQHAAAAAAAALEANPAPDHPSSSCCFTACPTAAAAAGGPTQQQHPLQQQHAQSLGHQQQQQDVSITIDDCGEGAVVTTQRLRAAVAPETVLQVSATPLEQIAVELREITQRMALLRVASSGEGVSMSGTLEECVMEYGKLCMRVHMGKNQQSVDLSSINLQTLQREQPPPGFWASIADYIQPSLTTEQVERLAFGFQVYLEKRLPLVSKSQEIVQQLQHMLGYQVTQDAATTGAAGTQHNDNGSSSSRSLLRASAASSTPDTAAAGTAAAAAAGPGTNAAAGSEAHEESPQQQQRCSSSSDSSGSLQFASRLGGLVLSDGASPERVDVLLQQLSLCTTQLWELSRHLIFHWVNTLNTEQMAASITMSFPYWVQPVPLCEYVWRRQQESYADGPCMSACSRM